MSATIAIPGAGRRTAPDARSRIHAGRVALWIVQLLLAALFLFAGGMKLVVPFATLAQQMPVALPAWFIHFIGVAEVLGALGLVLPGVTRIRPGLTPIAAAGLAVIMAGAVARALRSRGRRWRCRGAGARAASSAHHLWKITTTAATRNTNPSA